MLERSVERTRCPLASACVRSRGTPRFASKPHGVYAYLGLGLLMLAVATPAPVPQPAPTNPFNLDPIPLASPLPYIGGTRAAKPVCGAIRVAVAPAIQAAMKNDQTYGALRTKIFDYVVKDSDAARDMHLMQMDRTVDDMVKYVNALKDAAKSSTLDVGGTTKPDDAKMLRDLKRSLQALAAAEQTQLDAMSGFVETERMRRFGTLSETEQAMQSALMPSVMQSNGTLPTPIPVSGFLRDSQNTVLPQHQTVQSLHDAHMLDRDLGDIAGFTGRMEELATKVIVPAANSCR